MAKKRSVILDFEANLNKLVTSLGKLDKMVSGQAKATDAGVKANKRLLEVYERQAKAMEKVLRLSEKNTEAAKKTSRTPTPKAVPVTVTPKVDPKKFEREMNDLARRIDRASSFTGGGTSKYIPLSKAGTPLAGAAREAALRKRAAELNVPMDNLGLSGAALNAARARDSRNRAAEALSRQQAVAQRYERMRAVARTRAESTRAAAEERRERARVRLREMRTKRVFGITPTGGISGPLGKVISGTPLAGIMSATGGFSGSAIRGIAGRGALTAGGYALGGAMGGAAAAVGGPAVLIGLLVGKLGSVIKSAVESGVKTGFGQAFKLSGMAEGFREIMGAEGFNPIKYTEMMLQSKQELLTGTGSGVEADRIFKYAGEIAKKSPFQIPDFTHAGAVSARYGLDISKSYGSGLGTDYTLGKALGDITAGNKGKRLEDAIFTFVHEYIATADARSLKYRFSITPDQMINVARSQGFKGDVNTIEGRASAVSYFAKGQFGGASERLSETLSGKISNIRDSLILLQDKLGQTGAYMNAVNFFERIRVAIEKIDQVDPATGTSQLEKLSQVFTQVTEKLNEWVIEPIVAGFEKLVNAGSLDEVKSIIVEGLSQLLISSVEMAIAAAWEATKGIAGIPGRIGEGLADTIDQATAAERAVDMQNMSNVRSGNSTHSALYKTLRDAGIDEDAMKAIGAIKTGSMTGKLPVNPSDKFFSILSGSDEKTTGDFLANPQALSHLSELYRTSGLTAEQFNSVAKQSSKMINATAAATKAEQKLLSPEYQGGTPTARAAVEAQIARAQHQYGIARADLMSGAGVSPQDKSKAAQDRMTVVTGIVKGIAEVSRRKDFTGQFGLKGGAFMETGKSTEQLANEQARKTWTNDTKPALEKLGQIYAAILGLRDAIVGSIQKLYDIQSRKDTLQSELGALEGESPFKARERRKKTALDKLRSIQSETGSDLSQLSEGELLALEDSATAASQAITAGIGADPYADPASAGRNPGDRRRDLAQAKSTAAIAYKAQDERMARQREKAVYERSARRMLEEEERNSYRSIFGGDVFAGPNAPVPGMFTGREKGSFESILGMLVTPGSTSGLPQEEIRKRTETMKQYYQQQMRRKQLGVATDSQIPKFMMDMFGGETVMVDQRTGLPVKGDALKAIQEDVSQKGYLKEVGGSDFVNEMMQSVWNPQEVGQNKAIEAATQSAAELSQANVHLDAIRKAIEAINAKTKGTVGQVVEDNKVPPKGSGANATLTPAPPLVPIGAV